MAATIKEKVYILGQKKRHQGYLEQKIVKLQIENEKLKATCDVKEQKFEYFVGSNKKTWKEVENMAKELTSTETMIGKNSFKWQEEIQSLQSEKEQRAKNAKTL